MRVVSFGVTVCGHVSQSEHADGSVKAMTAKNQRRFDSLGSLSVKPQLFCGHQGYIPSGAGTIGTGQ